MFESRRDVDIPEGFNISVGDAVSSEEAYATIMARLEDAKQNLPDGWSGRVLMHAYADGSVDGELYVKVPEDEETDTAGYELSQAVGQVTLGSRYWVSMGARYIIEKDDLIYRRNKGMNMVQTNYQRATATNIAEEDIVLRKQVLPGMHDRYKREAHSVFIRLHWNPQNQQPKR